MIEVLGRNLKRGLRSIVFNLIYWLASIFYVLLATLAVVLPGRKTVGWIVHRYAKRMVWSLRFLAGIRINVVNKHKVQGQVIIAAKHHSWFDGFSMYSQFPEGLAFVTGDHLEKFPLLGVLLRKLGAIVVNSCGGHEARKALAQNAAIAANQGRNILIYPEGHLSAAGEYHQYRTGVYHMYVNFGLPVVPVATNLGCFAPQQGFWKQSGIATLQFLDPIPPGLGREEFMRVLEERIEAQSNILIAQAYDRPIEESRIAQYRPATMKEALDNLSGMS